MADTLSAADVMALSNNDGMNAIWNNPFIYFVWMALFSGGFGGGLFGGNNAAAQGALTRAELYDGLGRQDILRNQDVIQTELSSFERDAATKWGDIRYDNLQNIYGLQSAMTGGFYTVNDALNNNRFAMQTSCCETNRNIDSVKAEAYKNTCEITSAIHDEAAATRALITENTIQALRDRLNDKDRELLAANMQISQDMQNAYLVDALRPIARPAYITASPYTSNVCGGNCGCGL